MTGYGHPRDHRQCLEAGFDFHLVKPPDPDELAETVLRCRAIALRPVDPEASTQKTDLG
jgi:CheY-like chemotaxis protein